MRIISKFHDYYDSCQNPADEFCWVRDNNIIEIKSSTGSVNAENDIYRALNTHYHGVSKNELGTEPFIIGFCGLIYTIIIYSNDKKIESWEEYTAESKSKWSSWWIQHKKKFFDLPKDHSKYFNDIFIKNKTPSYVISFDYQSPYDTWKEGYRFQIELNPNLSKFEWFKRFNVQQAYQEIEMYLTGVLGQPERETAKIEDKYRIAAHGYDKWSFRKMPQQKGNTKYK